MTKKIYPNKLTIDQIEKYDLFETVKDIDTAIQFSNIFKGQVYTQIERNQKLFYLKGLQLKDKTGLYAIIKKIKRK